MGLSTIYFIFLLNYVYLIVVLARQNIRHYLVYCVKMAMAALLCAWAWKYEIANVPFLAFNAGLFTLLSLCPVLMTRHISSILSRENIDSVVKWSRWLYRITHARMHYWDCLVFRCWQSLARGQYQEARETSLSLSLSLPAVYAPMLERLRTLATMAIETPEVYAQFSGENWFPKSKGSSPVFRMKDTWLTLLLISINVLFFWAVQWGGGDEEFLTLLNLGANNYEFVFYQKEYWRLLASTFLHFGILHLVLNSLALHLCGGFVEHFYGKLRFLVIYGISGIFGAIASTAWKASFPNISLGASGAICGLMGASLYFFLFKARSLPDYLRKHYVFSFFFMIGAMAVMGLLVPNIDNMAHFGGILIGFVLGYLLEGIGKKNAVAFGKRIFVKATAYALIGMTLCTWVFQGLNALNPSYPGPVMRSSWYLIDAAEEKFTFALPFTWKLDSLMRKQENQASVLYPKESPCLVPSGSSSFWDVYNFSSRFYLFVNLRIHDFPLEEDGTAIMKTFREELQGSEDKMLEMSKIESGKSGELHYLRFRARFELKSDHSPEITALYYGLPSPKSKRLFLCRFQFPSRDEKKYADIVATILSTVSIQ